MIARRNSLGNREADQWLPSSLVHLKVRGRRMHADLNDFRNFLINAPETAQRLFRNEERSVKDNSMVFLRAFSDHDLLEFRRQGSFSDSQVRQIATGGRRS